MTADLFPAPHLAGIRPGPRFASLDEQASATEAWETPEWAVRAILDVEILTRRVVDPCCGAGVLADAAFRAGYDVLAADLCDWGYRRASALAQDFLASDLVASWCRDATVLMNPPFSLATRFVDRARAAGARKIVCFQRWAWRESTSRRVWWENSPPARIWLCGNRAVPWLITIPPEERRGGMQTAHAWYVWERGHRAAELIGTIWRNA